MHEHFYTLKATNSISYFTALCKVSAISKDLPISGRFRWTRLPTWHTEVKEKLNIVGNYTNDHVDEIYLIYSAYDFQFARLAFCSSERFFISFRTSYWATCFCLGYFSYCNYRMLVLVVQGVAWCFFFLYWLNYLHSATLFMCCSYCNWKFVLSLRISRIWYIVYP